MDFCPEVLLQKLQSDLSLIESTNELKQYKSRVLQKTLLKKYVPAGSSRELHERAINDFVDRNHGLSDKFHIPLHRSELFNLWRNRIFDTIMTDDWQSSVLTLNRCFLLGRPGPGSTRGTRHTDFYRKMWDSNYTYTNQLLITHFESSLSDRWQQASYLRRLSHSNRQVVGSSLTSVPKDSGKNRCICTEPAINMFYQLGAHSVFSQVLRREFNLDIRIQPEINKQAARKGSIDGSNATIDLSDASDHIHYDLVKQLFPPSAFRVLDVLRSPEFEVSGKVYKFNMISSMGNGFTFALMTYLLVTLLDSFLRINNDRYMPLRDGVFGDDIILPSHLANDFMLVLSDFGFKVNTNKSFTTGPFRESCGGDFLSGHDVRGVYIKELNNEAQSYSAFNRLLIWSIRHDIPIYDTLLYVKGLGRFRPVPLHESEDSGIRMPSEFLTVRKRDENGSLYYRPIVPIKRTYKIGDKSRNHFGAYISALGGYVRRQTVTTRSDANVRYQVVKRITPCWDYSNHAELKTQDFYWFWLSFVDSCGQ